MNKIYKVQVELDLKVMVLPEKGTCVAHDYNHDIESEEFSISELLREEIRNMGSLESYMGDEKVETVWIKDLMGILEGFLVKAETHNARVNALMDAAA